MPTSCGYIRSRRWELVKLQEQNMEVITRTGEANYELRFQSLHRQGRGWAFPCNVKGNVDVDRLEERVRNNYLFARGLLGREYALARVQAIA